MEPDELKAAEEAFAGGYDDKPTERPAVEDKPVEAEATPQDAPKPDADAQKEEVKPETKPDPLAEVLARMDKMQQSQDKLAGNLGRLQQSHEQFQANLAAARAATGQVTDAPEQADIKRAAVDPEKWAALKKDFPEWGEAVEAAIDARVPKFDLPEFEQRVNAAIEGKAKAMQAQMIDASLTAVFPGWKKDVQSDQFKAWFETQSDDIKATRNSDDVGDVARTLSLYREHQKAEAVKAAEAARAQAEAEKAAGKKDNSAREKRFAAAVAPKGTGGHAPGRTELDEFEAGYTG